jgi:hypothetical protein
MSLLIPYLKVILYILLFTSAGTLTLFVASFLVKSKARSTQLASVVKLIGAVTSLGALMVSALNVSTPIGIAPVPDPAKENIEKFYSAIEDGNFDTAFRLIHPARLDEIRAVNPNFNRDQFKELYWSTREYKNRFVSRIHSLFETNSRVYSVSFDVSDEIPRNRLYESRQALVKDFAQMGILNIEPLLSFVMNNLKESYDLPPNSERSLETTS